MVKYVNPIKRNGDFADPFVLRFNGVYYLYCTNPHVPCWVSDDLVNWTKVCDTVPEEEFPSLVPFAPEVVYDNGSFYMYTSPHGRGHYVLKSDSPLGPFHKISGNIGHAIDFSIFIDDDGKWYAYWADDRGIMGCNMPSPTEFGESHYVGAYLHGWTEGPFVVKRDGVYHLTYTGNHFLSKGYRINGAFSHNPLGPFHDYGHNPLLVSTRGKTVGLGHSSTVLGPNLAENWMFYHNLNPDKTRDLCLDRAIFHDNDSFLLGPTSFNTYGPQEPFYHDSFRTPADETWAIEEGSWSLKNGKRVSGGKIRAICTLPLPERGRAELHVASMAGSKGSYGIIFEGESTKLLKIEREMNLVSLSTREGEILFSTPLSSSFVHEAVHRILFSWVDGFSLWLDHRLISGLEIDMKGVKRIGLYSDDSALFGSVTISDSKDIVILSPSAQAPALPSFTLNIPVSSLYLFTFYGKDNAGPILYADGSKIEMTDKTENVMLYQLFLSSGFHEIKLERVENGRVRIDKIDGEGNERLNFTLTGFDKATGDLVFSDALICSHLRPFSCLDNWEAGILLRAENLSDGGEGDDREKGTNFFIGYRVAVRNGEVCLFKHAYDEKLLVSCPIPVKVEYDLTIVCSADTIEVFSENVRLFEYIDPFPIMVGRVGLHSRKCSVEGSLEVSTTIKMGGFLNE